jgi:G:T/U-mismatch repair DNA glycosylase
MPKNEFQKFIRHDLVLLFVGFNPVIKSLKKGHYFSSFPSTWKSSLWYQLHYAGFSEYLDPEDKADVRLFGDSEKRLGITDLVDDDFKTNPKQIKKQNIIRGRARLTQEIRKYKPKVVCFLGKDTYRKFRDLSNREPVKYGIQNFYVGESKIYLAAFPSSMEKTLGPFRSAIKKSSVDFPFSMKNTEQKIEILKDLYQLYQRYL